MLNRRGLIGLGILAAGGPGIGCASVPPANPPRTSADPEAELRLHTDWAFIERYRAENAAVIASRQKVDAVFIGDSITEGWISKRADFFSPSRLCRGIGGQTTPQLLVRFREDVVALKPRVVHILAGTNDIAGNTGPMTPEETRNNFMSMTEIAHASGIRVILASITPAANFPWRPGLETVAPIRAHNAWLRSYAAEVGAIYADYFSAMADGHGGTREGLAVDGVHPTAEGYGIMAPIAEAALGL